MTTKITTLLNTIDSRLATMFPNKQIIPYPESLQDNEEIFLRDGYGVKYNGGNPVNGEFCNYTVKHEISVVLSREFFDFDSGYSNDKNDKKSILEDVYLVQNYFYNVNKIGLGVNCDNIELGSLSGIVPLENKRKIRSIEINFTFTIKEGFI